MWFSWFILFNQMLAMVDLGESWFAAVFFFFKRLFGMGHIKTCPRMWYGYRFSCLVQSLKKKFLVILHSHLPPWEGNVIPRLKKTKIPLSLSSVTTHNRRLLPSTIAGGRHPTTFLLPPGNFRPSSIVAISHGQGCFWKCIQLRVGTDQFRWRTKSNLISNVNN